MTGLRDLTIHSSGPINRFAMDRSAQFTRSALQVFDDEKIYFV